MGLTNTHLWIAEEECLLREPPPPDTLLPLLLLTCCWSCSGCIPPTFCFAAGEVQSSPLLTSSVDIQKNSSPWVLREPNHSMSWPVFISLRWNPPGKRKQGRPKMTLRKTYEGDLKRWNWHGERPREKQKRDIHGGKGVAALSWMDRRNQRKRILILLFREPLCKHIAIQIFATLGYQNPQKQENSDIL